MKNILQSIGNFQVDFYSVAMSIHVTRAPTVPLVSYDTKRRSHLKADRALSTLNFLFHLN